VSGNYFDVAGVGTISGRTVSTDDDKTPGAHPVAVISEPFWRTVFGSDPAIAGRTVLVNDQTFAILGIAGNGFTGTDVGRPTDIWIPLAMQREVGRNLLTEARTNWLEMSLGLLGSVAFARMTGTLMFGVTAGDTATFAWMATVLAVVSLIGLSIPVRAATRLDALAAIRQD
jgi:hypothetical protein